jgi:hypothetical protein
MSATSALPERLPRRGELVQVRSRRWLVEDVIESAAGGSAVVRLACGEDDAQGEELDVLWDYHGEGQIGLGYTINSSGLAV